MAFPDPRVGQMMVMMGDAGGSGTAQSTRTTSPGKVQLTSSPWPVCNPRGWLEIQFGDV